MYVDTEKGKRKRKKIAIANNDNIKENDSSVCLFRYNNINCIHTNNKNRKKSKETKLYN